MSNELHQTRIAAQVCEIVHALSPGRVQNQKTLNERGFVVAPLAFLDGHVLLHAARQPKERNACITSGIPPKAVKVSSSGLGSVTGTRLGKDCSFGACPPSHANHAPDGCELLSKCVLLLGAPFRVYPWPL